MRVLGFVLTVISIIIVFFNYNMAILVFGVALLFYGGYQLQAHKILAYVQHISGFVFIIGILITGF